MGRLWKALPAEGTAVLQSRLAMVRAALHLSLSNNLVTSRAIADIALSIVLFFKSLLRGSAWDAVHPVCERRGDFPCEEAPYRRYERWYVRAPGGKETQYEMATDAQSVTSRSPATTKLRRRRRRR
jgi:hypothetical protein